MGIYLKGRGMAAVPTVSDLRLHLNFPGNDTAEDAELQRHLDAAIDTVGGLVGPLAPTPVSETYYGLSTATALVLRTAPVTALTAVSVRGLLGSVVTPQLLTDYTLDPAAGVVRSVTGRRFYGDVTVDYTAGWAVVPAEVHLATLIIAAHLWNTQRVPGRGQEPVPMGFAIPNRAATLLARHRMLVVT